MSYLAPFGPPLWKSCYEVARRFSPPPSQARRVRVRKLVTIPVVLVASFGVTGCFDRDKALSSEDRFNASMQAIEDATSESLRRSSNQFAYGGVIGIFIDPEILELGYRASHITIERAVPAITVERAVPGPLPLLGIGAAFGWSRKIRQLLRSRRQLIKQSLTPPNS